jgi:hypothetical protein
MWGASPPTSMDGPGGQRNPSTRWGVWPPTCMDGFLWTPARRRQLGRLWAHATCHIHGKMPSSIVLSVSHII